MSASARIPFLLRAAALCLSAALVAFAALTLLDHRLDTAGVLHFDHSFQYAVHGLARPWLTDVMLALTWIGSPKIFSISLVCVLIWLYTRGRHHDTALLALSIVGAAILNEWFKLHFHRIRPLLPWTIDEPRSFSYPSGHSLFSLVLYGTLAFLALHRPALRRRPLEVLIPATLLPAGIGLSRIYLGVHFPTDVFAGFLTGALWLTAVILTDRAWHRSAV